MTSPILDPPYTDLNEDATAAELYGEHCRQVVDAGGRARVALPLSMLDNIICGDNVEVMRQLPDECVDLTVTSPPYDPVDDNLNVLTNDRLRDYDGYTWNFKAVAAELYRVHKPGGAVVWIVSDATVKGSETGSSFRQALYFKSLGFNMETMIYEVAGTGAKGSHDYYWQAFEFMFVFSKGKPAASNRIRDKVNVWAGTTPTKGRIASNGREKDLNRRTVPALSVRTNIWRYQVGNNGDDQTSHPAPFPEDLARDHILSWSSPGDTVLDCFCGSGTTPKMAALLDRRFIGIEISEAYSKIARERVRRVQIQPKLIPFAAVPQVVLP